MSGTSSLQVPGYQVIQFLGSGARSTIWRVRDRQSDELFALKRVVKRNSRDGRYLEQAINEYAVGSRLEHRGLRRIYRIRRIKRWLVLREVHVLMELCEGKSLQEDRPESVADVVAVFVRVAGALAHMNGQGFVHADTKPNNIIVAPDGGVKLIDFGQSCPLGTVKSRIQGTPDFIAPEQVYRRPVDARTDVYNFGAALYWTLTGRPIPSVLPKESSVGARRRRFLPVERANPDAPAELGRLITHCVEPDPARRPASMNEVASRLSLLALQLSRDDGGGS